MSLIDSDSKALKEVEEGRKSGRKATTAGLNRFKGLNRFGNLTAKFKETHTEGSDASIGVTSQVKREVLPVPPADVVELAPEPRITADILAVDVSVTPNAGSLATTPVVEEKDFEGRLVQRDEVLPKELPVVAIQAESNLGIQQSTTPVQAEYKQSTNGVQTESKLSTQQSTNGVQTESKLSTQQSTNGVQTESKLSTQQSTNGVQTEADCVGPINVGSLIGQQKKVLSFLFHLARQTGTRISGPVTRDQISAYLSFHKEAVKTIIYRLCTKGFLTRFECKEGRGGYLKFEIPEVVFQQLSHEETTMRILELEQGRTTKLSTQLSTQLSTTPNSSSFLSLNNNTTTSPKLDGEWSQIEIPEVLLRAGMTSGIISMTRSHLPQVSAPKLQDDLRAFAFEFEAKGKKLPLSAGGNIQSYFFGALKKGYVAPLEYKTRRELEEIEQDKIYEERKKAREAASQARAERRFLDWYESKEKHELDALVPAHAKGDHIRKAFLQNHFFSNVDKSSNDQASIAAMIDQELVGAGQRILDNEV